MTKLLLFISIGIIIYLLLQPSQNAPLDQVPASTLEPIVMDPPDIPSEESISEEIQSLPIEENNLPAEAASSASKKKSPLAGLKLIGTIYGSESASAMLADANNTTFVVRLNQRVLKSDFIVTRIEKDRIYLRKNNKNYMLVMSKNR